MSSFLSQLNAKGVFVAVVALLVGFSLAVGIVKAGPLLLKGFSALVGWLLMHLMNLILKGQL